MPGALWFRSPPAARLAVVAAAWVGFAVVVTDLNFLDAGTQAAQIIWAVSGVTAAVAVMIDRGVHRRFGAVEQLVAYNRALRTGELPAGADVDLWRRRLRSSRLIIALAPSLACPVLIVGWLTITESQALQHIALNWIVTLGGVWCFVMLCRRGVRIRRLEAVVTQRADRLALDATTPGKDEKWKLALATPLGWRVVTSAAVTTAAALLALVMADLDSIVYGDSRLAHLQSAGCWALSVGTAIAIVSFGDPRMRATGRTVRTVADYDRALRAGGLPATLDPDAWNALLKWHRRSETVLLLWPCFFWVLGLWSVLANQSVYHWLVGLSFELLALRWILVWRIRRGQMTRLAAEVERHVALQPKRAAGQSVDHARSSPATGQHDSESDSPPA